MPTMIIIAGCNGSGKTTTAKTLLPDYLNVNDFVNADEMAAALGDASPVRAARITLEFMRELIYAQVDFAVETTLSGGTLRKTIEFARRYDYEIALIFMWIPSPAMAISRVRKRVKRGGHDISENEIRQRYHRGISNLFKKYLWFCDYWSIIDNSNPPQRMIAEGGDGFAFTIHDAENWNSLKKHFNHD